MRLNDAFGAGLEGSGSSGFGRPEEKSVHLGGARLRLDTPSISRAEKKRIRPTPQMELQFKRAYPGTRNRRTEARKAYARAWYHKNREAINAKRRAEKRGYYRHNIDYRKKVLQAKKEYYQRAKYRKYGLTPQDVEKMIQAQGNACAICKQGSRGVYADFPVIDHCHVTNRVRGILCSGCNTALGLLKDNPDLLRSAIGYLERFLALPDPANAR
jgi:hypothetical protein